VPGLPDVEDRCVTPFYLEMMSLNALNGPVPVAALRAAGQSTTDEEVAELLAGPWRPRVMGAWLAAGRMPRMKAAVFRSLETAAGSLTAPPLATVALYGAGPEAVPALRAYLRSDLEQQWGSASFVAAILERLNEAPADVSVSDQDRRDAEGMLAVAHRLAEAAPVS
jgi:hypothetical protein